MQNIAILGGLFCVIITKVCMKRFLSFLLFLVWCNNFLFAQYRLSLVHNSLCPDSLNSEIILPFDVGCEGENVTWDFSDADYDDNPDTTTVNLYCLSDRILWDNNGAMTTFRQVADSLLIIREETPLYEMDYDTPVASMIYPFSYGSCLSAPFAGRGAYEDKFIMEEAGISTIQGDAYGTLILTEGDTVRNVLRIHSTRNSYMNVHERTSGEYICTLVKGCDTYEWYAKGYRYPVLRAYSYILESDGDVILQSSTAHRMSPEMQAAMEDKDNESLREQDAAHNIINYDVTVNSNSAIVTYELLEDAYVSITLADSRGIVFWRYGADQSSGAGYQTIVPLSGLLHGQYIIYIEVNGTIYNRIINI